MNTYEIVTERIINPLEQGVIPWHRPWSVAGAPRNLISKKVYRGVNFFLPSATKYVSPYWLTLAQLRQLEGKSVGFCWDRVSKLSLHFIDRRRQSKALGEA